MQLGIAGRLGVLQVQGTVLVEPSAKLAADSSIDDGELGKLATGESGRARELRPGTLLETFGMGAA